MSSQGTRQGKIAGFLQQNATDVVVGLALFVGFWAVYFLLGQAYRAMPGYDERINIFFGADHLDALKGWVPNHKGTHPLVLLVVVPAGWILGLVFGSYTLSMIVFAATAGSSTVTLLYALIRRLTEKMPVAAASAVFFGFSMSQLVFGCIPETYQLATLSLLPSYFLTWLCLKTRKLYYRWWIAAGVATFSITITNTVQTALCLAVVLLATERSRKSIQTYIKFVAWVSLIGFLLSLLQKLLIPEARLFFSLDVYSHEMQYISNLLLDRPLRVVGEIFKTFFFYSWIGQFPIATEFEAGIRLKMVYYKASLDYGWSGVFAALFWLGLFLRGVWHGLSQPRSRMLALAIGSCVAFNMALHAVYGTRELFLYTPHFAFAVLLLCLNRSGTNSTFAVVAWWVLAILTAINNLAVVREMLNVFAG